MNTGMAPVSASKLRTGVPGLDDILNGGLIENRLYLLTGNPGCGKTTLALQFLLEGLRAGERCVYITLSETADEIKSSAASHGWSLEGIEIVELINAPEQLDDGARVTMYSPAEVELGETVRQVMEAADRHAPRRLVLDSVAELRLLSQDTLRYRRQVMTFKQVLGNRGCTVLMLDDRVADDDEPQVESIAHGILALEQMAPAYGAEARRLRVTKFRGSGFRGGFHDFTIRTGGLQVFPRLVAAEHSVEFRREPIGSGIAALDALLGGGPDRGTSTLIVGPAGAGKSTLAAQYAVAAATRGDHAALFAFDESLANLQARCGSLGIPLEAGLGAGTVMIQQVDPAEMSAGEFTARVREAVERDHARVVVIDTLNGYMNAMPEQRFMPMHLHELLSYLARQGVTTIMVAAQHGLVDTAVSAMDVSYIADAVVLLRYFEHAGEVHKAVSVVKKRTGGHENTIREIRMDARGIHLSEPLAKFQGILSGGAWRVAETG